MLKCIACGSEASIENDHVIKSCACNCGVVKEIQAVAVGSGNFGENKK